VTKEVWVYFSAYNVVPSARTISFSVTLPRSGTWQIQLESYPTRDSNYGYQSYTFDPKPSDLVTSLFEFNFGGGSFISPAGTLYPDGIVNYIAVGE
jgi:hypothetical protein